ncbi:unnamed protein product [Meloidogyne enterolobii]|uniref:Uncharacterized protein n=1 Tax=Meloidogyne enterolobii TaxID=390850 RepID=A0ACB0YB89_MELEN
MNYSYENYSILVIIVILFTLNLYCRECWAKINKTFTKITTTIQKKNELGEQQRIATSKLELNPEKLDLLLYNVAIFSLLKEVLNLIKYKSSLKYIATTAAQLARCIVPLLKEKGNKRITKEINNIENEVRITRTVSAKEERGLVGQIGSWLIHGLESIGINGKTMFSKDKTNVKAGRFEQIVKTLRMRKVMRKSRSLIQQQNFHRTKSRRNNKINRKEPSTLASVNLNTMRRRRNTEKKGNINNTHNIEKLRRVQRFLEKYEFCKKHLERMGEANSRFLEDIISTQTQNPVDSQSFRFLMDSSKLESLDLELQNLLSNYSFEALPILSPKLFSLFPNQNLKNNDKINMNGFLSPTLLSFQNEGILSLPTLFGYASSNEEELVELLDKFIELSGVSGVLDKLIVEIETKAKMIEDELYPALVKLELLERRWKAIQNNLTALQNKMLDIHGYAFLDRRQFGKLFNRGKIREWPILDEELFEQEIRRMGEMERTRMKRNSENSSREDTSDQINSLRPFTYTNILRQDAVVGVNNILNVLSPVAFIPSIMSPKAMALTVLSPTAFTANILTPNTLWTEILSPKFFHTNILSPRALASLVLSPRTMLGEVLSPKFIEFRVLNPTTFYAGVLTPNFLLPRVLSPSNFAVTVLSPNILSPSILSKGNFTVQVLSPSIMSDDITFDQLFRGEWQKETS